MRINTIILFFVYLISVSAVIFIAGCDVSGKNRDSSALSYDARDSDIKIPISEITEKVKWYDYDNQGKKIRYFAVRASDGSIKTAFDACDVCYRSKKGYKQDGEYMVCNNCGKRFKIDLLGVENKNPGGCWPGYLPNSIEGDNLIIKKSEVKSGEWRFK